jgi:hypothetical protein
MTNVISRAQGRLGGGWVGSSVVHLGDHNGTKTPPTPTSDAFRHNSSFGDQVELWFSCFVVVLWC